jgi:hypothetical protein
MLAVQASLFHQLEIRERVLRIHKLRHQSDYLNELEWLAYLNERNPFPLLQPSDYRIETIFWSSHNKTRTHTDLNINLDGFGKKSNAVTLW